MKERKPTPNDLLMAQNQILVQTLNLATQAMNILVWTLEHQQQQQQVHHHHHYEETACDEQSDTPNPGLSVDIEQPSTKPEFLRSYN